MACGSGANVKHFNCDELRWYTANTLTLALCDPKQGIQLSLPGGLTYRTMSCYENYENMGVVVSCCLVIFMQ